MESVTRSCPACGRTYPDAAFFCGADGSITIQDQDPGDFDRRLGHRVGGYVLVARVADGATGRVFEGRHPETKARVAIKILHEQVALDPVASERFKREYETTKELKHRHIVQMLEFGVSREGPPFLVMEYLEGQELGKLLGKGRPISLARMVGVVAQVALALEHAHSFGFIHRDLKPDNIFLCSARDGDEVRVLDFGSVKLQVETGAKLTAIGTTLGSPYYMSPEQAMGRLDVDQRSDVFALGAIVHEMLTDQVAFQAPNLARILLRILNDNPAAPSVIERSAPRALDAVVAKALRKAKEERYATVREFADALLAGLGLPGPVETWAARPQLEIAESLGRATPPLGNPSAPSSRPPAVRVPPSAPPRLGLVTDDAIKVPKLSGRSGFRGVVLFVLGLLVAAALLVSLWR
jgi:serine/threonine protein kinase